MKVTQPTDLPLPDESIFLIHLLHNSFRKYDQGD